MENGNFKYVDCEKEMFFNISLSEVKWEKMKVKERSIFILFIFLFLILDYQHA